MTILTNEHHAEITRLAASLQSGDARTVQAAIAKISRMGPADPGQARSVISGLAALLQPSNPSARLQDSHPELRMRVCWALGQIGYKMPQDILPAIAPLTKCLTDEDAAVRANAVWALGRIGRVNPRAVLPILPAMMCRAGDPEVQVRSNFLSACENIAADQAEWLLPYLPVLIRLLDDEDTRTIRRQAPEVLRIIAKKRPEALGEAGLKLESMLDDPDEIVRLNAGRALSAIQNGGQTVGSC
jgi:HEAT repeat protein